MFEGFLLALGCGKASETGAASLADSPCMVSNGYDWGTVELGASCLTPDIYFGKDFDSDNVTSCPCKNEGVCKRHLRCSPIVFPPPLAKNRTKCAVSAAVSSFFLSFLVILHRTQTIIPFRKLRSLYKICY